MPTAVVDVALEALPEQLEGLHGYGDAWVLLRVAGRPVGQALVPVEGGRVTGAALRAALVTSENYALWEAWLHARLDWHPANRTGAAPALGSVAVCTRERPDDLRRCLAALAPLLAAGHELLVVDNRPATDATRRLVEEFPGVRYLREDRPGLSAARNRALREAAHEVVAFTDDDAIADPDWLARLLANFDDPLVRCVTGLTVPLELETEAQELFERHSPHGRGFVRRVFSGASHHPLAVGPIGAGVNLALRRSALDEVGPFDEALGAGTPACAGEDYEYFSRLLAAGYRIVYDPAAVVRHRHRRSTAELRATLHGYGVGVYAALTHALLAGEWSAPRFAWGWFRHVQLPALLAGLRRRPGSLPPPLVLAQLRGCLAGPRAYAAGRRRLARAAGEGGRA